MKNHNSKGQQSNSIILEDDAGYNQFNDTLSLEDDPFFGKGKEGQLQYQKVKEQPQELWNMGYQNKNEFCQFENNMASQQQLLMMSSGINAPNKDFAGETFSQISSTFEQQAMYPHLPSQPSNHKMPFQVEKSPQNILSNQDDYKNNDELLDLECFNKSFQNSPIGGNQKGKGQLKQISSSNNLQNQSSYIATSGLFDEASIMKLLDQTFSKDLETQPNNPQKSELTDNFKYECADVAEMLTKISQTLKTYYKNNRGGVGSSQVQIQIDDIKQLEILSTSAIQKVRDIQALGENLSKQVQSSQQQFHKDYMLKVRSRIQKQIQKQKITQKKHIQRMEDQKFKYAINEFELNSRVSQLEDAFNKQQDEINKQANKNELLQREKQVLAKKYEKRMNEIEGNLKTIIENYLNQDRFNDRTKSNKVNNSFSCNNHCNDSLLLLPPTSSSHSKQIKRLDSEKENNGQMLLQVSASKRVSRHNTDKKEGRGRSLQSQLVNLKNMIKQFKKVDTQQQQEGGHFNDHTNSLQNFLSQLINLQNDSMAQQSQYNKPESSQASINQAFIQSKKGSSEESKENSQNNTSFFGKEMFSNQDHAGKMKENMSSLISLLISARTGNNNYLNNDKPIIQQSNSGIQDEDVQRMLYDRFKDLSMTQQEKLIEEIWMNRKQIDDNDKRDVDLNDILEISKKTINSVDSSIRTSGRPMNKKEQKRDSDQLSILRILKGVSSVAQMQSVSDNDKKDKNNSTLEISFNQNEIQIVDGQYQQILKEIQEEDNEGFDQMRNLMKLDEKISARDIMDKAMLERSQKQALQQKRDQILQNNRFFGNSLQSERGGGIASTNRDNQQNSVEEDLKILNDIQVSSNKKQKQQQNNLDFADLSLIEANNSLNVQTAGRPDTQSLMMTGSIHKDSGDSLYSGGSSLLQMNVAFLPPKESTKVMTIKVQDREIKIPKLDINRVIALERREPYKFEQVQNQIDSCSSSETSQQEPSSFQNESVQKPFQVTDNIDHGTSEEKDLDRAIIVEEQESDSMSMIKEDQEDNIFGSFKNHLLQDQEKQEHNKNDDTLDLDMDNEIQEASQKKPQRASKLSNLFSKDSQPKVDNLYKDQEPKDASVQRSQNTSFLKKSQSENQLTCNQDLLLDENLLNQQNYDDQSTKPVNVQEKKKSTFQKASFDFKKIKTPTNVIGLKFNFANNGGALKIVKNVDKIKGRSSSSGIQPQQQQEPQQVVQSNEKEVFVQNCEEEESMSPNKKDINKSILIKASLIKLSKVQRNNGNMAKLKSKVNQSLVHQPMNEISCAQDQSMIASSFFQDNSSTNQRQLLHSNQEDNISQVISKPTKLIAFQKIIKQRPQQQEDSLIIQPKDNVSLLQNYFSASESVNQPSKSLKLRPSSGGKKLLKISGQSLNMRNANNDIYDQPYRASSNSILKISKQNITSSCEFEISDDANASRAGINDTFQQSPDNQVRRTSKSNTPQKTRISVLKKQVIAKVSNTDQSEQKITLNRISLSKRRTSDNNSNSNVTNTNVNQSEIMYGGEGPSVIHQQQYGEQQNMSYLIPHNESVLKGLDDASIMLNNKSINLKSSKQTTVKATLLKKHQPSEERKEVQQPKIIQNLKVNNLNSSQINSNKSINKMSKINQILLNQQQTQPVGVTSVVKVKENKQQKVLCNENLHIKKEKKALQPSKDMKKKLDNSQVRPTKTKQRNPSNNQTLSSSASMRDL